MRKWLLFNFFLFLGISFFSALNLAGQELTDWQNSFRIALQSGKLEKIKLFFEPNFAEEELESWKYNIQRGFLDFNSSLVIQLANDAILVHIGTDLSPYSGEISDKYFDFIYRVYRVKRNYLAESVDFPHKYIITARCMEDFNPDFLTCLETLELIPSMKTLSVDSEVKANLISNRLIFKLAKEFQLKSLTINGKKQPFQRFGYFVYAKVNEPNPVTFRVKGKIVAVSDHNQFFCIDDVNFFLRSGGFAAAPSPPPDNRARPYFSSDQAEFTRKIIFPSDYKFLGYGDVIKDENKDGRRFVTLQLIEKYLDGLSFYAQVNWNVKRIQRGSVKIGFYFPVGNQKEQEFLEKEINSLLDWLNKIFKKDSDSEFKINFVVLDKFVEAGLLNDSQSIIASKASIIGSGGGGYIHEICHTAPQPLIEGNVLWVKEGFTNYLSFNFLRDVLGKVEFWKQQKRIYLHRFGLYCEPLKVITNKGIPCYWSVYQKGPWIFRMLETELGKGNFEKTMMDFGKKQGIIFNDTNEYFKFIETVSGRDLSTFRTQWLGRKQNPVLQVRYEVTAATDNHGEMVTIHVFQEDPLFYFPLDIEIRTEKQSMRHTLQLDAAAKKISIPIASPLVSVQFDPDDRVFALIKEGKSSFVNPLKIHSQIKKSIYHFKSDEDNRIIEFEIKTNRDGIELFRRNGKEELRLDLDWQLSPKTFYRDGKEVYSVDTKAGKIHFSNDSYDISEPVYPYQFDIVLFCLLNWEKTREESLVYLYNSGYNSGVLTAKRKSIQEDKTVILLDDGYSPIELYLSQGMPMKYTIGKGDDKETFTRLEE